MTRSESLTKLLALGDLTAQEIRSVMGGSTDSVDQALAELKAKGVATVRNSGFGQQLITLKSGRLVGVAGGA